MARTGDPCYQYFCTATLVGHYWLLVSSANQSHVGEAVGGQQNFWDTELTPVFPMGNPRIQPKACLKTICATLFLVPMQSAEKHKLIEVLQIGDNKTVFLVFDKIFWPPILPLLAFCSRKQHVPWANTFWPTIFGRDEMEFQNVSK